MRRTRAALTALIVVMMSVLVAGPASAGGPTSGLLVHSDTSKAASLYYSDADYTTLSELVGANSQRGLSGKVDTSGSHAFGSAVTLTWLIHDVAVWRVDRIYLDAEGGPWVSTQLVMNDSGNVYDSPSVWHTVTDAGALRGLFERVGLGFGSTASGADAGAVPVPAYRAVTPAPEPAQETSRPASPAPTWGGWAWGLAGLALGLALALAGPRVLSRARRGPGPHPDTAPPEEGTTLVRESQSDTDAELAWTPADELSWSGSPRG
jgi:hypothetical protein